MSCPLDCNAAPQRAQTPPDSALGWVYVSVYKRVTSGKEVVAESTVKLHKWCFHDTRMESVLWRRWLSDNGISNALHRGARSFLQRTRKLDLIDRCIKHARKSTFSSLLVQTNYRTGLVNHYNYLIVIITLTRFSTH